MQLNTLFTVGKCFTKEKQQQKTIGNHINDIIPWWWQKTESNRIVKPVEKKMSRREK